MKISEAITNKYFLLNPEFSKYKIENNTVYLDIPQLDLCEEVECVYYWYDHLTRGSKAVKEIEQSLEDKNWNVFSKYLYKEIPHKCTLPNYITVFSKTGDYILGELKINEETIQFLNWAEYECG